MPSDLALLIDGTLGIVAVCLAIYVKKWMRYNGSSISQLSAASSILCAEKPQKDLSVIIPAFNESKRLPKTLRSLLLTLSERRGVASEIIIVDDGSSDGTISAATSTFKEFSFSEQPSRCTLITARFDQNSGKGMAVTQV